MNSIAANSKYEVGLAFLILFICYPYMDQN